MKKVPHRKEDSCYFFWRDLLKDFAAMGEWSRHLKWEVVRRGKIKQPPLVELVQTHLTVRRRSKRRQVKPNSDDFLGLDVSSACQCEMIYTIKLLATSKHR